MSTHRRDKLTSIRLVVLTEGEVFSQKQKKVRALKSQNNAERIKSYLELKVGDFVVHSSHGIGKYMGINTLNVDGMHRDYMYLQYAGNDKLYVPIDLIEHVQKYVGSDDREPRLHTLGGNEWKRVKSKVKASVSDLS